MTPLGSEKSSLSDTQDVLHQQHIPRGTYCKEKYIFLSTTEIERLMKIKVQSKNRGKGEPKTCFN
jgi:hypothetical protein